MLYSISIEDRRAEPIQIMACSDMFPSVSPDDKLVAYREDGSMKVKDLTLQSLVVEWAESPWNAAGVAWSPTGQEFSTGGGNDYGLGMWVYDIHSREVAQVLDAPVGTTSWSPDRTKLALYLRAPYCEIWIADLMPGMSVIQSWGAVAERWRDVAPRAHGTIRYEPESDTYTLAGSGSDIWEFSDEFHYAYKQLRGDGAIVARIESVDHVHDWTKAGVMIRESLGPDSTFAAVYITPLNRLCFEHRSAAGRYVRTVFTPPDTVTLPHWIRLIRESATFRGQHSSDGLNWQDFEGAWTYPPTGENRPAAAKVAMNELVYIGLPLTSHAGPLSAEATVSHVTVSGQVNPNGPFSQSQDIGFEAIKQPMK